MKNNNDDELIFSLMDIPEDLEAPEEFNDLEEEEDEAESDLYLNIMSDDEEDEAEEIDPENQKRYVRKINPFFKKLYFYGGIFIALLAIIISAEIIYKNRIINNSLKLEKDIISTFNRTKSETSSAPMASLSGDSAKEQEEAEKKKTLACFGAINELYPQIDLFITSNEFCCPVCYKAGGRDYFQSRDYNKKLFFDGCPYFEDNCNLDLSRNKNSVIYIKKSDSKREIYALSKYLSEKTAPDINIKVETKSGQYDYKFFSAYKTTKTDCAQREFENYESDFKHWCEKRVGLSKFKSDYRFDGSEKLLTVIFFLSSNEFEAYHFYMTDSIIYY